MKDKPKGNSKFFGLSALSASGVVLAMLSYFRFAQITAIFGANWRTDALAVAMVFPHLVREVVSHSFGSAFIPIYSRVVEERGHEGGVLFVNKTISWLVIVSTALIGILWFSSGTLVRIVSPNGSEQLVGLASSLVRLLLPIVALGASTGVLANFVKYEKRFAVLSLSTVLGIGVSLLVLILVRDSIGIRILPISMLAGSVVEFLYLLIQSFRSGFRIRPSVSSDTFMNQLARMAFPVVGGTMVGFFAPIADKMLASFLPESSVTAIDYANRIKNIVLAVIFQPLLIFADLSFSAEAAKGEVDKLLSTLRKNINISSLVMFPSAALLTVLAVPVVSVFFQRGNFTGEDSRHIGYALAFYAPWLAQFGAGSLVSRAFYAQKDSATPVTIGIIGVVVNVLLNLIFVGPLGIGGLALATTLMSTSKTLYLTWSLSRKMGGLNLRLIAVEQLKILASNLILVLSCITLMKLLPFSTQSVFMVRLGSLGLYAFCGLVLMTGSLHLMGSTTYFSTLSGVAVKIRSRFQR